MNCDKSFVVNCDVVCAWICVGEERYEQYANFVNEWEIDKVNRSSFFTTQDILQEIVVSEGKQSMQAVIDDEKYQILMDTQNPGIFYLIICFSNNKQVLQSKWTLNTLVLNMQVLLLIIQQQFS